MYSFESLEIAKSKYLDMWRVLLNEQIKFPGYNKLATHRSEVTLSRHIDVVSKEYPVGVAISYRLLLTHTIKRLLTLKNIDTKETDYPLCIRISDGLDGSGCHRIYQQAKPFPDLSTKNFILFAFRICSIFSKNGTPIWENSQPNSPFSMRPISILALLENDENVLFLMDRIINSETSDIEATGLELTLGNAKVEIVRTQFDSKMAKLLSGAGGAQCQLCTATFSQIHDKEFVREGFPINRFIRDAKNLFEEVNDE